MVRGNDNRHQPHSATQRAFSTTRRRTQAETALQVHEEPDESRQQYSDLLDIYESDNMRGSPPSKKRPEHFRLAPRLAVTPEQETRPPYAMRQVLPPIDDAHKEQLKSLAMHLRNKPGFRTEKIWSAYVNLPHPRMRYLEQKHIRRLFRHMAWVEKRNLENSQRYFSLLEDALAVNVKSDPSWWNTAISFAGRWVRRIGADDVKAAIETWLRMEREGGVSANNVTFNILFDVAVKAGRFALADTIHAELVRRDLELNRYFRTSMIYYAGKRGDAENVRALFRELVAAGEIVDTAVMNCVILSLVRCGEAASAEHVMAKMKLLHEQKFGTAALKDWRGKKFMGRQLDDFAREFREERAKHLASFFGSPNSNDDKKEEMQRAAPIAPDPLTYSILIHWHTDVSGNLDRIREHLAALKQAGYRIQHNVYFNVFNGFNKHGGYAFTAWNRKTLEMFWQEYVESVASDAAAAAEQTAAGVKTSQDKPAATIEPYDVYPLEPSEAPDPPEIYRPLERPAPDEDDWYSNFTSEDHLDIHTGLDPLPSHLAPMEFRPGVVMAALGAFYKCAGVKRMLEVWEEVQKKWPNMSAAERRRIEGAVGENVRKAEIYIDR